MCATTSKLLLKSMPCTMDELGQLIQELKLIIPRSLNSFGRRRVLLEYSDAEEAQKALNQLLGLSDILDKPLRVSCFGPRTKDESEAKTKTANKSTQATAALNGKDSKPPAQAEINKYVQKLYACSNQFDFKQPPPPYLRYAYPPINADIMAGIGDALKSNERFYVQVLHLMNRMNLPPPFGPRPKGIIMLQQPQHTQTAATQTEKCQSETESELESEDEVHKKQQQQQHKLKVKRPAEASVIPEQYRKRARQILQAGKASAAATAIKETTESPTFAAPKIELKLPSTLPTVSQLPEQRLTDEQLQELPIYKNYKLGDPSNKLYIKNLDKNVTEAQLRTLYARYAPAESLDIKVMQQGRMKGQAFVEFKDQAAVAAVVGQALAETNGLVWQQKPMIVCYGKQQAQQPQSQQ